jgi:hypothetical protein
VFRCPDSNRIQPGYLFISRVGLFASFISSCSLFSSLYILAENGDVGLRSLCSVFWKGRWVIAQYGQFDGYPEGQGVKIIKFLSVAHNIERLKEGLEHVHYLTEEEIDAIWIEIQQWEMDLSNQGVRRENRMHWNPVQERYPTLQRETSARILGIIAGTPETPGEEDGTKDGAEKPKKIPVQLQLEFANDTLFCEWAYVIDLDQEVLEVYGGGEDKHDGHRFKDVGGPDDPVPAFICSITFREIYLMKSPQEFVDRVSAAASVEGADDAISNEGADDAISNEGADDAASDDLEETTVQVEGCGA